MTKIIIANWKKNPETVQKAQELFVATKKEIADIKNVEVVVCPPAMYLSSFSEEKKVMLGAQDFQPDLNKWNVKYVILGHSDRRRVGETDDVINKKIKSSLRDNLKVILCVGEKEGENKEEILTKQLSEGLKDIPDFSNIMVAYEPVWAIGTGNNCSIEETKRSVEFIKSVVQKEIYPVKSAEGGVSSKTKQFDRVNILYGGSVTSENSAEYLKDGEVDGLLVGGASLNAEEFAKIVQSAAI